MKQPKRLNSRFPGTCSDCGSRVETGEPILWLRKNTIVCSDCDAAGYDDAGRPLSNSAAPAAPAAGDWSAALSWDDSTPAPGASIGDDIRDRVSVADRVAAARPADQKRAADIAANSRPEIAPTLFRDMRTGEIVSRVPIHELSHFEKYPGNCVPGQFDTAGIEPAEKPAEKPAPVVDIGRAKIARQIEPTIPALSPTAATVRDLLVTLVNAIDRLTVDDAENIAAHCAHFAADSDSGSRSRVWENLSRVIH